uniref:Uncharacterized protein n=1 Tax=Arundo donax TaxID=35708 RepID=A0A0A9EQL7_ARUDO
MQGSKSKSDEQMIRNGKTFPAAVSEKISK